MQIGAPLVRWMARPALSTTLRLVIVEGKGEDNPRYSNKTKESRAKNRRVELTLIVKNPAS